jgi:hypothetical protein
MAGLSTYLKQALANELYRNTNLAAPANVYISLHTADPGATGASEVSGGSYARVTVSTTGGWSSPTSGGLTDNAGTITFPTATADWGTVTHVGIWDASSAGNFIQGGALSASKAVYSGDTCVFDVGALDVIVAA